MRKMRAYSAIRVATTTPASTPARSRPCACSRSSSRRLAERPTDSSVIAHPWLSSLSELRQGLSRLVLPGETRRRVHGRRQGRAAALLVSNLQRHQPEMVLNDGRVRKLARALFQQANRLLVHATLVKD